MTLAKTYHFGKGGPFYGDSMCYGYRYHDTSTSSAVSAAYNNHCNGDFSYTRNYGDHHDFSRNCREYNYNYNSYAKPEGAPSLKRRKSSNSAWEDTGRSYQHYYGYDKVHSNRPSIYGNFFSNDSTFYSQAPSTYNNRLSVAPTTKSDANGHNSTSSKRDRSMFEEDDDDDVLFMSRDEIEQFSPSRKDGIDAQHETHLRYSYCAFLQNLGLQLEL